MDELIQRLEQAYKLTVGIADSYQFSENRSYYHHLRGKSTGLMVAIRIAKQERANHG